jgi:predicted GNAT family acetyltransferase
MMVSVAERRAAMDESTGVVDDVAHSRLVYEERGALAELVYRRSGDRLILVHTGVPEELGGRGIGGQLVRRAVEWAATDGLIVVPRCPFARKWLQDHPDVARTVSIDWMPPPESS